MNKKLTVTRLERGWAGHFICSSRCRFRRNTLLDNGKTKIVVSTVGLMELEGKFEEIGINRYYETMAFHAQDDKYLDADVSKQINFTGDWAIDKVDAEIEANQMHENVVNEITELLTAGEEFKNSY